MGEEILCSAIFFDYFQEYKIDVNIRNLFWNHFTFNFCLGLGADLISLEKVKNY